MAHPPTLSFDRGTLLLHPPPRGKAWIDYATWDDRAERFHLPAWHSRHLIGALQAEIEAMAHRSGLPVLTMWRQWLDATAATLADTHPLHPAAAMQHGIANCVYVVCQQLPPWLRTWVSMWWALSPASARADFRPNTPAAPSDERKDTPQPALQHLPHPQA